MLQSNSCCTSHYTRRQWLSRLGSMAGAAALLPRSAQAVKQKPMRGAFMILATPYTASKTIDYEDLAAENAALVQRNAEIGRLAERLPELQKRIAALEALLASNGGQ